MGSITTEQVAAIQGAAQKFIQIFAIALATFGLELSALEEAEEVFRRILKRSSAVNTSNMDTAKSKNYDLFHLSATICNKN